jgi:aminodeoxyfutalosine synthase
METSALEQLADRIEAGRPLTDEEAGRLAGTDDIIALGVLADRLRRGRHGTTVTFVRVADVTLADAAGGVASWPVSAKEIRLVGEPQSFHEARAAVRAVAVAAGPIPLTGFSLAQLEELAEFDYAELARQLADLRDEGLSLLAEACVTSVRDLNAAVGAAREAKLPVASFTVGAAPAEGFAALCRRVGPVLAGMPKVSAFAPLPRQQGPEPTTGYEDVKGVALARILLSIDHIRVDWRLHGPKLAQVALTFGADDVDNVSARDSESEGRRRSAREEILRNIQAAGFTAAERDGRFALLD